MKQKVLCVLYEDPAEYPLRYPLGGIPVLTQYPDGQSIPSPRSIAFTPGELLGSVSGELGLGRFLTERGHEFVVTADKDGPGSQFEKEMVDADVVISQPFWPAYLTAERIAKSPNLWTHVPGADEGRGSRPPRLKGTPLEYATGLSGVYVLALSAKRQLRTESASPMVCH